MPAGDAGLERQTLGTRQMDPLMAVGWNMRQAEIDRLQAQLAAQQAAVDAARELWQVEPGVSVRSAWRDAHLRLGVALIALDAIQAAQPEGES